MSFSCTRRVPFVYPEQKRNPKTLEKAGSHKDAFKKATD